MRYRDNHSRGYYVDSPTPDQALLGGKVDKREFPKSFQCSLLIYQMVAGAASESAAPGYGPDELPYTLPGYTIKWSALQVLNLKTEPGAVFLLRGTSTLDSAACVQTHRNRINVNEQLKKRSLPISHSLVLSVAAIVFFTSQSISAPMDTFPRRSLRRLSPLATFSEVTGRGLAMLPSGRMVLDAPGSV
jgi:hypothetical protein